MSEHCFKMVTKYFIPPLESLLGEHSGPPRGKAHERLQALLRLACQEFFSQAHPFSVSSN